MRFADRLFRQGHLSDSTLSRILLGAERPAHLDECDTCRERSDALDRRLTALRAQAVQEADAAFPAERLAVQQAQILRRLAQVEEPSRVLEFPGRPAAVAGSPRRVAPAWLAVAAAAGLVVGVVGSHMSATLDEDESSQADQRLAPADSMDLDPMMDLDPFMTGEPTEGLLAYDLDPPAPATLQAMDEYTPSLIPAQYVLTQ